jgi:hypothetical protein
MAAAERIKLTPKLPLLSRGGTLTFDPPIENRLTASAV